MGFAANNGERGNENDGAEGGGVKFAEFKRLPPEVRKKSNDSYNSVVVDAKSVGSLVSNFVVSSHHTHDVA
jgi:hypothetical protein